MPGRPRTRAKKLAEIEERLFRLVDDYVVLMPDRQMSKTGIDHLWDSAFRRLSDAQLTAEVLLHELEVKFGLPADDLREKRHERDFEGCMEAETAEVAT